MQYVYIYYIPTYVCTTVGVIPTIHLDPSPCPIFHGHCDSFPEYGACATIFSFIVPIQSVYNNIYIYINTYRLYYTRNARARRHKIIYIYI